MMEITHSLRKELDALSKEVFGTASRWQKMVDKGYKELLTEEVTETIPAEKEGEEPTTKVVKAPVLLNGSQQYIVKRHTLESVKEFLLEGKKQLDEVRAQIKKHQEEALTKKQAEEKAKQIHKELSGSAK